MSKNEAVSIASRVVGLYLFCWALEAVSFLPERLVLLPHETSDFWHNYNMLSVVFTVIRVVALFGAALFFFECGPRTKSFFLPARNEAILSEIACFRSCVNSHSARYNCRPF
jgi:hypothetical protein